MIDGEHDEIGVQSVNNRCGILGVFMRMGSDILKYLVLPLPHFVARRQYHFAVCRASILVRKMNLDMMVQFPHKRRSGRDCRSIPWLLDSFLFGLRSLLLGKCGSHLRLIPRFVSTRPLLIHFRHWRHAVKRNEHAAGGAHDRNARVNAVADALQQFGFILGLFVGGELHLAHHIVNHAVAVEVQVVDAGQLGESLYDAGVFF